MTQPAKQKRSRSPQIKFFAAALVIGVLLMIGGSLLGNTGWVSTLYDIGRAWFTVGLVLFMFALGGWELQPRRTDAEMQEMVMKALTSALEKPHHESTTTPATEQGSAHA